MNLLECIRRNNRRENGRQKMQANLNLHLMGIKWQGFARISRIGFKVIEKMGHHVMLPVGPMGYMVHIEASERC